MLRRPVELAALPGHVDQRAEHLSGNPTNRQISSPCNLTGTKSIQNPDPSNNAEVKDFATRHFFLSCVTPYQAPRSQKKDLMLPSTFPARAQRPGHYRIIA